MVARLESLGGEVARCADRLEDDEVVLAPGRRLVGREVGERQQGGGQASSAAPGPPRRLDLGGQRLGPGQQLLLLLALGLGDLLAERLLLATPGLELRDRLRAGRRPRRVRRSTTSADSPRLAWAARTRSGSSRRTRGSITGQGYPGCTVILAPVLDRPRSVQLGWATLCFALFGLVTLAVLQGWGPLAQFDDRGRPARDWAVGSGPLRETLLVVETIFETLGMTIMTSVVSVAMWVKGHRRAAVFTVGRDARDMGGHDPAEDPGRPRPARVAAERVAALDRVVPLRPRLGDDRVRVPARRAGRDARPTGQPAPARLRRPGGDGRRGVPGPGPPGTALPE